MVVAFSPWRPLVAAELETLPESPGVFEVGTLVRSVLYIGAAPESLTATLTQQIQSPGALHAHAAQIYFRYCPTDDAVRLQADLLQSYRDQHTGALPPVQATPPPSPRPIRHLKAVV